MIGEGNDGMTLSYIPSTLNSYQTNQTNSLNG